MIIQEGDIHPRFGIKRISDGGFALLLGPLYIRFRYPSNTALRRNGGHGNWIVYGRNGGWYLGKVK